MWARMLQATPIILLISSLSRGRSRQFWFCFVMVKRCLSCLPLQLQCIYDSNVFASANSYYKTKRSRQTTRNEAEA